MLSLFCGPNARDAPHSMPHRSCGEIRNPARALEGSAFMVLTDRWHNRAPSTPVLPERRRTEYSCKAIPGSPLKHFDERLIAIEGILGDELHWGSCGSVVEARDDDIGRFVKSGTSRQLLRALPFNLQNCRTHGNVPNYRAGMLMAAGLLTGLKRNLANIDRSYLPVGKSCLQKWLPENRGFGHGNLMSRNTEGRNPRLPNVILAGTVRCARAALARNASAAAAVGGWAGQPARRSSKRPECALSSVGIGRLSGSGAFSNISWNDSERPRVRLRIFSLHP